MTVFMMAAVLAVVNCGKPADEPTPAPEPDPEPVVEASLVISYPAEKTITFTVDRGTADIVFSCTDAWTVAIEPEDAKWVSVYPHSGVAGDDKKVTVTVRDNETTDTYAAKLVFSYSDKKEEVSVSQEGLKRLRYNYTGAELLPALAATYETFLKDDLMPKSVEMDNMGLSENLIQGYYYEAMCLLLADIAKGGEEWKTKTYALTRCIAPSSGSQYETFAPDSVTVERVLWVNDKQYTYAQGHYKVFANYCTVDETYFSFTRSLVVNARILHEFQKSGKLPEKVLSWQSDFLRGITYDSGAVTSTGASACSLDDPAVIAARDAAINGKTTEREKAEAIFYFARDEWEWLDYYNTRKGAVQVINGKEGNCCDLTHGIIAIARSAGIRARYVHGPETYYPSGSIWGHVWPELYVDGVWYICDASNNASVFGTPTWDQEKTVIRGKYKDLPF